VTFNFVDIILIASLLIFALLIFACWSSGETDRPFPSN